MNEYQMDPYHLLRRLERERDAHMQEGQILRALAARPIPAVRPKITVVPLYGFIIRLRQALAAPARESEACSVGATG